MTADLTRLISRHVDQQVVCDRWCSCGVQHPLGYAAHLAEVIAAEFLVVPRSEVVGMEYAIERRNDGRGVWRYGADDEADARRQSATRQVPYAETFPVSRPILPWTPIPLEEVPDGG